MNVGVVGFLAWCAFWFLAVALLYTVVRVVKYRSRRRDMKTHALNVANGD